MREHWQERISEYLDGELQGDDRRAFESRMESDAELASAVEEVRQIIARAGELERPMPPAAVWEAIAARIAEQPRGVDEAGSDPSGLDRVDRARELRRRAAPRPGIRLGPAQLVAACVTLVMVSAFGGWWLRTSTWKSTVPTEGISVETGPLGMPIVQGDGGSDFVPTGGETVPGGGELTLAESIAQLERELRARGDELDEETRVILEDNLILIDRAIREARQALVLEPGSEYLTAHLTESMKRKARLLQQATRLPNTEI